MEMYKDRDRKPGKVMPFSQAVLGTSPSGTSRNGRKDTWVAPSVGMVNQTPSKPSAPSLRGKKVY